MEYIETQVKDAVACCYINRNEVKNALNRTIIDELGAKIGSLWGQSPDYDFYGTYMGKEL
ncbi:MAG TPA: hypothetical protein PLJ75_09910 [Spirochaetota bacterium]|nr:hypothetical protein [Spirochaetota bacterium]